MDGRTNKSPVFYRTLAPLGPLGITASNSAYSNHVESLASIHQQQIEAGQPFGFVEGKHFSLHLDNKESCVPHGTKTNWLQYLAVSLIQPVPSSPGMTLPELAYSNIQPKSSNNDVDIQYFEMSTFKDSFENPVVIDREDIPFNQDSNAASATGKANQDAMGFCENMEPGPSNMVQAQVIEQRFSRPMGRVKLHNEWRRRMAKWVCHAQNMDMQLIPPKYVKE